MEQVRNNRRENAKQKGEQLAKEVADHPWIEKVMRMGFIARGVIYGLVGILAIQVALESGQEGRITDQQGAIATIGSQPFGQFLLILIAIGLVGYSIWGFIRAFLDPLNKGTDAKGLVERAGFFVSGLSYLALLIPTIRFISGNGGSSGGDTAQQAASTLMAQPFGPFLVGIVGLAILGAGIAQIIKGWKARFDMNFDAFALSAEQRKIATRLGRFGYIARGLVFGMIGGFLIWAALTLDPQKARGLDGALATLAQQPYGPVLLAVVAAGLIAFGAYSILGGLWFRFKKV